MILFCAAVAHASAKTLLILNSYHEDELWANGMIEPIISYISHKPEIDCELVYLTNSIVSDSTIYQTISDNIFERFSDNHPDYLVLMGNFAFTLRDRIRSEWGDIPMLLISRSRGFGELSDYFATLNTNVSIENPTPIESLRDQYNFTAIFVPDYCTQTVDLMVDLIPNMDQLVFLADVSYVNRIAASRLSTYLTDKYPKIKFRWLMAAQKNASDYRSMMVTRNPKLGLLLSSWTYEIMSTCGYPVLTCKDLAMISSSVNPVFTLRQAYLTYGTIGGVFTENDKIKEDIVKVVEAMIAGKSMHDIPFYEPSKEFITINYPRLEMYGLDIDRCPKDTIFINRPLSYWEKFGLWTLLVVVLALLVVFLLLKRNNAQRNKIEILNRHIHFTNNMPVPYTCVKAKMDADGKIIEIELYDRNKEFERMVESNTGAHSYEHVDPSIPIISKINLVSESNKTTSFTYHFEQTDRYYDIMLRLVNMIKRESGKTLVIDVFARDITNRHKMQMALKNTASKLDMTIAITKLIPWQLDWTSKEIVIDTNHDYANPDSLNVQRIPLSEYMRLIHPDDLHIMQETIDKLASGEIHEYDIEYRVVDKDNPDHIEWIENIGAVTLTAPDDSPLTITGSVQIVTQAKEKEEQMRKALKKANESDRLKSSFLANMSHEIRTPLNAIVGFSSMMVRTKTEEERQELSNVINKNNDLLLNLINDVLDLAKIESNTIELVENVCDIDDLLESVCKTMSIRIPRGVKLNIVHYTENCKIKVDSGRLTQLLINLLTNACKFTKKGNITVGYEIIDDDRLYFYVKDTGIGIPKEKQDQIFDQFVKLNNFAQGTGLGLAICQSLVERMGGEIGVTSEGEGRGSMFWFTLPYVPVDIPELDHPEDEATSEETNADDTESKSKLKFHFPEENTSDGSPRQRMLVAEDNESNYWLLQQMLRDRYQLVWAQNGKEAVELCQSEKPDLIIMDINMPEMDGYQAVAEIRKFDPSVPIIAVTAYAFASDRIRILNSGFNAYVSKPISEIALFDAIHHVINGHNEHP